MNKVLSIGIIAMLMCMGLMVMPEGATMEVDADVVEGVTELFYADTATTAQITGGVPSTNPTIFSVKTGTNQAYLTFNFTTIPAKYKIMSATLYINYLSVSALDARATLYNTDNSYTLLTEDTDTPLVDIADTNYGVIKHSLAIDNINRTGLTEYLIVETFTLGGTIQFSGTNSTEQPYVLLTVGTETGVMLYYNFTTTDFFDNYTCCIQPNIIIDYGSVYIMGYEVNTLWGLASGVDVTIPESHFMYYNASTAFYCITENSPLSYNVWVYDNMTINLWFYVEKYQPQSFVTIAPYHYTRGDGLDYNIYRIYTNEGTGYNNTTAIRRYSPTFKLELGKRYTASALDYFGNHISNRTFIVSNSDYVLDLAIPIYSVTWNSLRNDTTAISVFFNGTGTPWQEHVSGGKEVKMGVREGAYMFRFDYMTSNATGFNTITATYFYNLTINGTHTINIGTDGIGIIMTTLNGNTITIANIETALTPSLTAIYYLLPEIPTGGTRSASLTDDENVFIAYHPYHIIDASIYVNGTGTNVSLTDNRPTNGTVRWLSDLLYINANPYAHIMLNDSTGNILDLSSAPAFLDITAYALGDITVWSNQTIQAHRISEFRQVQILTYSYVPESGLYYTAAMADNPSAENWRTTLWYIGYARGSSGEVLTPDFSTVRVYDVDNAVNLLAGAHYDVSQTSGAILMFDTFNSSVQRNMQVLYFLDNGTAPLSAPIISIRQYEIDTYAGETLYKGTGIWVNNATQAYSGAVSISLKGLQGTIDATSLIVLDKNGNRLPDMFYTLAGTTLIISDTAIGTVNMGESVSFTVYFAYEGVDGKPLFLFDGSYNIGWVNLNWHLAMLFAAFGVAVYGTSEFVTSRKKKDEAKGFGWLLIATFLFLGYIALWIWHVMGVI